MSKTKKPGVLCAECGCRLDPGERCDCERITAEQRKAKQIARTRSIVEHNLRMVEQAQEEFYFR